MTSMTGQAIARDTVAAAAFADNIQGLTASGVPALSDLASKLAARERTPAVSRQILSGIVRLVDMLIVAGLGIAAYYAYVQVQEPELSGVYVLISVLTAIFAAIGFHAVNLYATPTLRDMVSQLGRIVMVWTATLGVLLSLAFFLKLGDTFSRAWLSLWYAGTLLAFSAWRGVLTYKIAQWTRAGRLARRAVIVGGGADAASLIEALSQSDHSDIEICGIFDDRKDARSPDIVGGYPKLGSVRELISFARQARIDLLIVALPISAENRLLQMLKTLWVLPVDIRLAAHTNRLRFRPRAYSYIGGVPMLDVFDKPITDWDHIVKAVFDRVIGVLALIAAAPVMLAVAVAVKLDSPGPIFFKQKRYGFNNQAIEVFKFRSLYTDRCDAAAAKLVTRDDPRVTRVGRFIRKTSLDELPQLFNVLRGELSLVGPRPHALQARAAERLYDEVVDGYFARHKVKPGITGWAQINGWRGETDTEDKIQRRVEHDLYYIENWSILFDLFILLRTPISLLSKSEAAY